MAVTIRKKNSLHFIFVLLFLNNFKIFAVGNQSLYLDSAKKYYLSWTLDNDKINFLVRVNTSGYVGFGLSPNHDMVNSDIVIGGVRNSQVYFKDYYALDNSSPMEDDVQNWNLISCEESDGQTILKFWRNLYTGDSLHDKKITDQETYIIWAYGTNDDIIYHNENRGSKSVSFFQLQPSTDESTARQEEAQGPNPTTDEPSGASVGHQSLRLFSIIIIVTMVNIFV